MQSLSPIFLDPSERKLVAQARDFSHAFEQLLHQAIDLNTIDHNRTKPMLTQFLDQNRVSVVSLRDFRKTATE